MAEAHSAVAFTFTVSHDGVSVSYDQELLRNIYHSIQHDYKRRMGRFRNNFRTGIYPASPSTLLFTWLLITGFKLTRLLDFSFGFIGWSQRRLFKFVFGTGLVGEMVSTSVYSCLFWVVWVQLLRTFIKGLFSYKGWIHEPRGRMSLTTKVWLSTVSLFSRFEPMLHSFQGALPRLPLPALATTIDKHLKSVRPVLDDKQYDEMVRLSEEFKTVGKRFQWYLFLKSLFSVNYVTDWWEEYVYLRCREPLMINSNYYGLDTIFNHPTKIQAARAANITRAALMFRRQLDKQEAKPIMHGGVPLCSAQYERLFNSCRIPGEEADQLKHWTTSRHVAVLHKGRWWKCPVHTAKRLLTPVELQRNLQKIIDDESTPVPGEQHLAALTAGKRVPWAKARQQYFQTGVNKNSLATIESAAFCLILDDTDYEYDPNDYSQLDDWALAMFHGKGYDRWFDKSFNLVVSRNGRSGLNAEHSWGDAPIIGHFLETCNHGENIALRGDAPIVSHMFEMTFLTEWMELKYTDEGNCVPMEWDETHEDSLTPTPERLKWDFPEECQEVIESSLAVALGLIQDVELKLLVFNEFGKGFMKKSNVSPDAFIQMALQTTYFKLHGHFGLTYEASMTRLYREARTETVRSVTQYSTDFIRGFLNPDLPVTEKTRLLREAAVQHVRLYRDAMAGRGIDRHLFALYVVSKYLEVDSPFLKSVIHEPWLLSTSQTPHQQTDLIDLNKNPQFISAGGGFGPVSDYGYGVSYIIGGENMMSFHISSKKCASKTSSQKFRQTLIETLGEMRELLEAEAMELNANKSNGTT